MSNPWRLLLLRSSPRSRLPILTQTQVLSDPAASFSSLFHTQSFHSSSSQSHLSNPQNHDLVRINLPTNQRSFTIRNFSSEAVVEQNVTDHVLVVTEIFNKNGDGDVIRKELEANGIVISHDLVLKVLKNLESNPTMAKRFFDWVLESNGERLSSKSYNKMLRILGDNGFVQEFWDLVDAMKKKGYGVAGHVSGSTREGEGEEEGEGEGDEEEAL